MSVLTYNGITLPYSSCSQFNQTVKYDESNTDWYCTEYDIVVQAIVNSDYLSLIAPGLHNSGNPVTGSTNPANVMTYIRRRLMAPRNELSMKFNGVELIPKIQSGLNGTVDAQNGPRPQYCNIADLMNNTFVIHYRITAQYWEKLTSSNSLPTVNQKGCPVLYNRWTETVDINNCNYSTRTREGKFVIRSDNFQGFIADRYRESFAVVGIPPGHVRQSSQYTISPDGLGLSYRFVDVEVFKKPPYPAFVAEGDFTESVMGIGGLRTGEYRLRLEGDKNTDQVKLIEVALSTAQLKMQKIAVSNRIRSMLPVNTSLRVDSYRNIVELRTNYNYLMGELRLKGIAVFAGEAMTFTPNSVESYTPPVTPRGSAGWVIGAASYYDPSLTLAQNKLNQKTGQKQTFVEVGTAGVVQEG